MLVIYSTEQRVFICTTFAKYASHKKSFKVAQKKVLHEQCHSANNRKNKGKTTNSSSSGKKESTIHVLLE